MRVITAIYVFCKLGLRDEWISGGQGVVDEWIEGARGVEAGWRGVVGWWHGREYRDEIAGLAGGRGKRRQGKGAGGGRGVDGKDGDGYGYDDDDEDNDFFARELEKMGWSIGGLVDDGGGNGGGNGNGNGNGNGGGASVTYGNGQGSRNGNANGDGNGDGDGVDSSYILQAFEQGGDDGLAWRSEGRGNVI